MSRFWLSLLSSYELSSVAVVEAETEPTGGEEEEPATSELAVVMKQTYKCNNYKVCNQQ